MRVGGHLDPLHVVPTGALCDREHEATRDPVDMGITRGCEVYVRKVAPLGDPIEVTVRGYELSLRKADAEMIVVE